MNEARMIQSSMSTIALLVALLHMFDSSLTIDSITLALLVIAFAPWLAPMLKSLKLPGGVEVEFKDLEKIQERAKKIGLIPEAVNRIHIKDFKKSSEQQYTFQIVADEDPNLALAGLRIELERVMKNIATSRNVPTERVSLGKLLFDLADRKIITDSERAVLSDLVGTLNRAVHGADVDVRAERWAMDVGLQLLRSLDEKSKT